MNLQSQKYILSTLMWSSQSLSHNLIHISNKFLTYDITGLLPLKLLELNGLTHFKLDDSWKYTLIMV